jgi:hypothetical protein
MACSLAEEAPVPGMNEKVTGRNFDLVFEPVRVRYDADSHWWPILSP